MLHIDINLLFTVINMLVLFGALWLVLFKPVRKILDERQAEANREYDEAKSKQEEAESLKQEYEDNLQKIEQEKSETLANARRQKRSLIALLLRVKMKRKNSSKALKDRLPTSLWRLPERLPDQRVEQSLTDLCMMIFS